jgi:hypothetical protein
MQSFAFVNGSACIVWHDAQSVVECSWMSASAPWGRAWQPMHVEDGLFGAKE